MATPVVLKPDNENRGLHSSTSAEGTTDPFMRYSPAPAPDLVARLTRAHPQSEDGEMRHRAAADIARLTEELRLARIEIKALERYCMLLSENYDRLLASTRRK